MKKNAYFIQYRYLSQPLTSLLAALFFAFTGAFASAQTGLPWSWGYGAYGQIGDGTRNNLAAPAQIPALSDVLQVAEGGAHTLILIADGTVWGCGLNAYGEVGDGTAIERDSLVLISTLNNIAQVAAGKHHSLALKLDGTVWAWGWNQFSQLGNGTTTDSAIPLRVSKLAKIVQIRAGGTHSLALKSDGTVWSWGENTFGELGDGTKNSRTVPAVVSGLSGMVQVCAGKYHSLALKSDGTLWAWGFNGNGQLGDGTTKNRLAPVQITALAGVVSIAAGKHHSLALKSDGTVWAWGDNTDGQLGDGTAVQRDSPTQVAGMIDVVQATGGYFHTVALKSDGTVWAWGDNEYGQLGDGTLTSSLTPVQALKLAKQTCIAADGYTSLSVQAVMLNTIIGVNPISLQYAKPINASATLTDVRGALQVFKALNFSIDGTSVGVAQTNAAGKAILAVPNQYSPGQHTLLVSFVGDATHGGSETSVQMTVLKADTRISVSSLTAEPGQNDYLSATLKRLSDDSPLSNVTLTFKIDGKLAGKPTTDGTGEASLAYAVGVNLSVGAHTLAVTYAGDANENAASGTGTLTIAQAPATLTAINVSGTAGNVVQLSAKLVRNTDKTALAGRTLSFQVDGESAGTATTNSHGKATLNYTIPAAATKGKHPIAVAYAGETFYLGSSDSSKNLTVE